MSLLKHASGVLPAAVQHLPQTKDPAFAGDETAPSPTPTALQNFIVGTAVTVLVIALFVGLVAALSVSG